MLHIISYNIAVYHVIGYAILNDITHIIRYHNIFAIILYYVILPGKYKHESGRYKIFQTRPHVRYEG